jgi:hypothetical protein
VLAAAVAAACSDGTGPTFGVPVFGFGNGAPTGTHYNLNFIGVPRNKTADMTGNSGHRIFFPLWGSAKVLLCESGGGGTAGGLTCPSDPSVFQVLDANATDGTGAFALPNPDPDNTGTTVYSVYVRALGTPGGHATNGACGVDPAVPADTICSVEILTLTRSKGQSKFENVTRQLLYVFADVNGDGVIDRVPLFDDRLIGYFWEYDNAGLKLAQFRFYSCSTTYRRPPTTMQLSADGAEAGVHVSPSPPPPDRGGGRRGRVRMRNVATRALAVGLAGALYSGSADAQRAGAVELGAFGRYSIFDDTLGLDDAFGGGARLGVFLARNSRSTLRRPTATSLSPHVHQVLNAPGYPARYNVPSPFARLCCWGGGFYSAWENAEDDIGANGLVGLRIGLSDAVALRLDGLADYVPSPRLVGDDNLNFHAQLGISALLGAKEPDSDADGVVNGKDSCPTTPAGERVDADGCPLDADRDGVSDAGDRCPTRPGGGRHRLRSDTDGDGVV